MAEGKLGGRCKGRTADRPAGHCSKRTRLQLCAQCRVLTYAYVSERELLEEYRRVRLRNKGSSANNILENIINI